ncbi:MAG TPA: MFS transporter [Candidatus Eremiobacteraceae bacterium]|nr:MFS transporter [Candidatus Eremiobacteraceae bacterium]
MKLVLRLLPILGITFIDIFGFSILIPIVPLFAQHFGASDLVIGLLFATFSAFQFVAGFVWGRVSDLIGRKAVLIISQIGATFGWVMLAFAKTLPIVFLARIIEGASGGNISVTQAYVADKVEPAQRSRAFGLVGASFAAGMVFGPLFGAPLYNMYGFPAPFLFAAALQLITLILTIFMLPESRTAAERSQVATASDIVGSLTHGKIAPLLWQQWMYSLALYAMFAVFSLYFKAALHYDVTQIYYLFAAFAVTNVILQGFVVGPVSEALGDRRCSNLGLALAIVSFCVVPFVHDLVGVAFMMLPFSAGMALARPTLASLITDRTPDNQRGVILGTGSSLDSVSGMIMPPVSTGLLGMYGPAFVSIPSTLFSLVSLTMGLIAARKENNDAPAAVLESTAAAD